MRENNMPVYVLLRASKRTGKINKCMTGITPALMKMWGLSNTRKNDITLIIERDTGRIIAVFTGTADGYPKTEDIKENAMCTDMGIPLEELQAITDDRFD